MQDDDHRTEDGMAPAWHRPEPDPHGEAALLLVESVLHILVEANVLTLDQAIDAVRTASEVKIDLAAERGGPRGRLEESLALLAGIGQSLGVQRRNMG